MIFAPSRARGSEVARPMPEPPPVTSITLPCNVTAMIHLPPERISRLYAVGDPQPSVIGFDFQLNQSCPARRGTIFPPTVPRETAVDSQLQSATTGGVLAASRSGLAVRTLKNVLRAPVVFASTLIGVGDAGGGDVFVEVEFQIVMAGDLVFLAAFLLQAHPPRPASTKKSPNFTFSQAFIPLTHY